MSDIRKNIIALKNYMETQIIGQEALVKKLIITLLADGHALVEGAPGLAKTKAIKTLAQSVNAKYNRIQFTPDLLPSDITGSDLRMIKEGHKPFPYERMQAFREEGEGDPNKKLRCPICKQEVPGNYNYCPNCGQRLR